MKLKSSEPNQTVASSPLKRRGVLVGAGAAGAAVVAARIFPGAAASAPATVAAAAVADTSAGYRVTAHVLRYYESAKA